MIPSKTKDGLDYGELIDTLPKALKYLFDCNVFLGSAHLIKDTEYSSLLVYQATFFFPSRMPRAFIPENPRDMETHLYRVFDPFLYRSEYGICNSVIDARALPLADNEKSSNFNNKVRLTMLLSLPRNLHQDTYRKLEDMVGGCHKSEVDIFGYELPF
jgi:hypothetical protein